MKHITIFLAGIFCFSLCTHAQIKKQFKQETASNTTTVVIKDSKDIDDHKLLKDSFALDQYDVGDIIHISTEGDQSSAAIAATAAEPKMDKRIPKVKKAKKTGRGTPARSFKKRRKKPNKKNYVFTNNGKKAKRPKWDKKCYTW